jgi:hypothetical protein
VVERELDKILVGENLFISLRMKGSIRVVVDMQEPSGEQIVRRVHFVVGKN